MIKNDYLICYRSSKVDHRSSKGDSLRMGVDGKLPSNFGLASHTSLGLTFLILFVPTNNSGCAAPTMLLFPLQPRHEACEQRSTAMAFSGRVAGVRRWLFLPIFSIQATEPPSHQATKATKSGKVGSDYLRLPVLPRDKLYNV